MSLLYENVKVNLGKREITFPFPAGRVNRKESLALGIENIKPLVDAISCGYDGEMVLRKYRGKQGGCARLIKNGSDYVLTCPLRDHTNENGPVMYVMDTQGGFTTDWQEKRDMRFPWSVFSVSEGLEETQYFLNDGKKYVQFLWDIDDPFLGNFHREFKKRVMEESKVFDNKINIDPDNCVMEMLKLIPLKEKWKINEIQNNGETLAQDATAIISPVTGGIEIYPGILLAETYIPIASSSEEKDSLYMLDTEENKGEWLARKTIGINTKDGHTTVHGADIKNNKISVLFNGELEDAINGGVWQQGKFPFYLMEHAKKVIKLFPEYINISGLEPLFEDPMEPFDAK